MRVLALTRYQPSGPSSRVRFFQYLPFLQANGVEVVTAPLMDDEYIRRLYTSGKASLSSALAAYARRLGRLLATRSFDLVWLEKELFPWLPAWGEALLSGGTVPYVVDYDDAVFHRYDLHPSFLVRVLLGRKIDSVMRHAATVVVGNEYLAERARRAGARRLVNLPSVVDTGLYQPQAHPTASFRIGWIGSPVTAPFLASVREALAMLRNEIGATLVLVGAGERDPLPGLEKELLPWSLDGEVARLQSFDVGIMPLTDGPFERGKCGYKLIQYMACGLPTVASPVGVNADIVEAGKTGFLASGTHAWVQALVMLAKDAGMRKTLGQAGRKKVEQEYSLQVAAPRLLEVLTKAAG